MLFLCGVLCFGEKGLAAAEPSAGVENPPTASTLPRPDLLPLFMEGVLSQADLAEPTRPVRREELCRALVRVLDLNTTLFSEFPFYRDVSTQHPDYIAIEVLRERGLVHGLPGGFFQPDAPLTARAFYHVLFQVLQQRTRLPELSPETVAEKLQAVPGAEKLSAVERQHWAAVIHANVAPPVSGESFSGDTVPWLAFAESLARLQALLQKAPTLRERPTAASLPRIPTDLVFNITPTSALFPDRLPVGTVLYFMTTEDLSWEGSPVLPKGSRLRGQIIAAQEETHVLQVAFSELQTPEGQHYSLNAALPLTFPAEAKQSFRVPGEVFQIKTTPGTETGS